MAQKAPGKFFREGLSLIELGDMFPDDAAAERWFTETRWPNGVHCLKCGSFNIQERPTRKPQPYRCRDCRKDFSAKTGTLMQGSNLGFRKWVLAIYIVTIGLKGTSSMRLHRDLKITQKTAWHLAHRIRETWARETEPLFSKPLEADETFVGGRERNKHSSKKLRAGRGPVGKAIVVGAKDRDTNRVSAAVVEGTDAETLQEFVKDHAEEGATGYTDDHGSYHGMPFDHETVKHSVSQYVNGQAHTNGIESFLGHPEAGLPRHLSPHEREASGPLRQRVLRTPQRSQARHL